MVRENRRFFLWITLAGLALRLLFFVYFPAVTDDSRIYIDLAQNWLQHGIYGQTELGQIVPADTRLPGYPAFLAAVFGIFGVGSIRAVMVAQILLDLCTCLIIADVASRIIPGSRAARVAFFLTALCPFLANYAAAVLTETLEVFFTALALDCAVMALGRGRALSGGGSAWWLLWVATGTSIGACILLRPDGGILLVAVAVYVAAAIPKQTSGSGVETALPARCADTHAIRLRGPVAAAVVAVLALAPLVPWTIRNFRALHHFQPLAPRYGNESEELSPRGFNRWVGTWMADYASVEEIYWSVPGDKIDVGKLPSRALDSAKDATLEVIAEYNQSQQLTPQIDARFSAVAAENIRAHPIRYFVVLPLLRIADMWLRPRTELLPPDVRWWEFNDDTKWSVLAVGWGVVNLVYVAAALLALMRRHADIRYLWLLVGFLLLRSAFLGTIENPEPRYTLECYPVIIVLASAKLARKPERPVGRNVATGAEA